MYSVSQTKFIKLIQSLRYYSETTDISNIRKITQLIRSCNISGVVPMTSGYGIEVGRNSLFTTSELSFMDINVISDEDRIVLTTNDSSIVRLMSYDLFINNLWKLTNSRVSEDITNIPQFIVGYDVISSDLQRIVNESSNLCNNENIGDTMKQCATPSDDDMMLFYMLKSVMPKIEDIEVITSLRERIEEHSNSGRYPFLPYSINTNAVFYKSKIDDILPIVRRDRDLQYTTDEFIDTLRRWHNAHIFRDLMT